jgi:hypothetical protein
MDRWMRRVQPFRRSWQQTEGALEPIFFFTFMRGWKTPVRENIVAYSPVSKQWLCKQRPFLGNGSVNTFLLLGARFLMQQLDATRETECFLLGPRRDIISRGRSQLRIQFCKGVCEGKFYVWYFVYVIQWDCYSSCVLKSVARKRLVETVIDWGH